MWLTFVGSWFSFLVQCICLTVLHDLQLPRRLEIILWLRTGPTGRFSYTGTFFSPALISPISAKRPCHSNSIKFCSGAGAIFRALGQVLERCAPRFLLTRAAWILILSTNLD